MKHRIWIELPKTAPVINGKDRKLTSDERREAARLATLMLQRLSPGTDYKFEYSEHDHNYWYGNPMGGMELVDNGHWFNLNYLAGEK